MADSSSQFTPDELEAWQQALGIADRNNILHHCLQCDRQWVATYDKTCVCGGDRLERIPCWQFPDG
jgi:hypothetical protein